MYEFGVSKIEAIYSRKKLKEILAKNFQKLNEHNL